jgi:hypothetical protein
MWWGNVLAATVWIARRVLEERVEMSLRKMFSNGRWCYRFWTFGFRCPVASMVQSRWNMFYTDVLNSVTHTVSKSVLCCMDECVTSARSCTVLCQRYEMQGRIVIFKELGKCSFFIMDQWTYCAFWVVHTFLQTPTARIQCAFMKSVTTYLGYNRMYFLLRVCDSGG